MRGRVDQLLAARPSGAAVGSLAMPLSDIADWVEAWRLKEHPAARALTAPEIALHAREHQLLPVVPPANDVIYATAEVIETYRIETVLSRIISDGMENIKNGFIQITGPLLIQALRLQFELERAHGSSKDEIADALEEVIRRREQKATDAA